MIVEVLKDKCKIYVKTSGDYGDDYARKAAFRMVFGRRETDYQEIMNCTRTVPIKYELTKDLETWLMNGLA